MSSKKSAKSKGYRRTIAKKPYITKKELGITAAIIAALILVVVLFNVFYDDGSLPLVDGKVVTEGMNSLVIRTGSGDAARYYKLGQLADMEGYTLSPEPTTDENIPAYHYMPDETADVDEISFSAYAYDADLLGQATHASLASIEGINCSESMLETEIDGHKVSYFLYTQDLAASTAAADGAETEKTEESADGEAEGFLQALSAYISIAENRCIVLHITNDAASEAEYVEDAVLTDLLDRFLPALSYETK